MIRFLSLLTLVFWPCLVHSQIAKPETLTVTLHNMAAEVQALKPDWDVTVNLPSMLVEYEDSEGNTARIAPDNLHQKLLDADTNNDRQIIFDEHIAAVLRGSATREEVQSALILPVIRNYIDHNGEALEDIWDRPFLNGATVQLVIDLPDRVEGLSQDSPKVAGRSFEVVLENAKRNLRNKTTPLTIGREGPFMFLQYDGFYESSFLLLPEVWEDIEQQAGPVIVAIPTRDLAVFVQATDAAAVENLNELARRIFDDGPYSILPNLLARDGDEWKIYRP